MGSKNKTKNQRDKLRRISRVSGLAAQRSSAVHRSYARKHSNIMGMLYKSELSEIDIMVQAAGRLAQNAKK